MLNINFNLRDAKAQKETPLRIILRYNNQKLVYPSGLKINPKYWNEKEQTVKQTEKFKEHPEFNRLLRNLKARGHQIHVFWLFPKIHQQLKEQVKY